MKITNTDRTIPAERYSPLPVGNGSLSLLVDFTGSTLPVPARSASAAGIWIAGMRYDKPTFPLIPFGGFTDSRAESSTPLRWRQTLDLDAAAVETECEYPGSGTVRSRVFVPFGHHAVVIEKECEPAADDGEELEFRFRFAPPRVALTPTGVDSFRCRIDSEQALWQEECCRCFAIGGGAEFRQPEPGVIVGRMTGNRAVFVIAFDRESAEFFHDRSFAEIRQLHEEDWRKFRARSRIADELPEALLRPARTAEYHLRISATRWSLPVGIFPTHWQGRYFGFDGFFGVRGLIAAGHAELAAQAARHYATLLPAARKRAYQYFGGTGDAARYAWEGIESASDEEGSPAGFWREHIFHTTHIALIERDCAEALGDAEFARDTAYPVIRACAEFFRQHHLYRLAGNRTVIGKCTDLERLGPARENAFMTTCGAAATFRAAAAYARRFGADAELAPEWERLADELLRDLPRDDGKYLVYPGAREPSIALLSGSYPYDVLAPEDPLQRRAIEFFCANEKTAGNMYPVGDGVCVWYAGWKALALLRLGEREAAEKMLDAMAAAAGDWSEIFEIRELGNHPWFMTAEGIYLETLLALRGSGRPVVK